MKRVNFFVIGVLRGEIKNWVEEIFEEIISLKNINKGC